MINGFAFHGLHFKSFLFSVSLTEYDIDVLSRNPPVSLFKITRLFRPLKSRLPLQSTPTNAVFLLEETLEALEYIGSTTYYFSCSFSNELMKVLKYVCTETENLEKVIMGICLYNMLLAFL